MSLHEMSPHQLEAILPLRMRIELNLAEVLQLVAPMRPGRWLHEMSPRQMEAVLPPHMRIEPNLSEVLQLVALMRLAEVRKTHLLAMRYQLLHLLMQLPQRCAEAACKLRSGGLSVD